MGKIRMEHGSGGAATERLIEDIFKGRFDVDLEDAAVFEAASGKLAMSTDSFVVTPYIYPGGDIGRLAVCGTVNDILMRGAVPRYITCGYILQEGLDTGDLDKIAASMKETADEAGIKVLAGDTKVVDGDGSLFINTAGVGEVIPGRDISSKNARSGDVIIVSGNLGDHHAAILSSRLDVKNDINSDTAPLNDMVLGMLEADIDIHSMRDVTRGGLATVLKELAVSSGQDFYLEESRLPVSPQVKDFCGLMGLDPLYMGNEGKLVAIVGPADADRALNIIRGSRYGENACIIGHVDAARQDKDDGKTKGRLYIKTAIGGLRSLDILKGEGLPRIC